MFSSILRRFNNVEKGCDRGQDPDHALLVHIGASESGFAMMKTKASGVSGPSKVG